MAIEILTGACFGCRNSGEIEMVAALRDLVVHLDGGTGDAPRLQYADILGAAYGAHISAAYTNIEEIPVATGYLGLGAGQILSELKEAQSEAGNKTVAMLRQTMTQLVSPHDFQRFDVYLGEAFEVMCTLGHTADLTIMSRPYKSEEGAPELVESVIFGSGRGVLLVPPDYETVTAQPENIVVAWRNTREAARAVAESMPFLKTAKSVTVAMVDEEGAPEQFGSEPGADVARYLDRQEVNVELKHLTGWNNVTQALMNEVEKSGAGMLVMGSYGHSRLRQWVLGGVTRHALSDATVPVLTAH